MIKNPKRGELEQGWYWYSPHDLDYEYLHLHNFQERLSMVWVEGQYLISYGPHGDRYSQNPVGSINWNFAGYWWPVALPTRNT